MKKNRTLLCLAPLAALYGTTALSQETIEPLLLDTIIVRGELQDRSLFETPTSVVVETGEELEKRGDVNIYDLVDRTPGVYSPDSDRGFTIRGINNVGEAGRGSLISTQVDGVALPNERAPFFGPLSTWDLEQVEILRGPQSTQQGRNALAGAVILQSAEPDYDPLTKVRVEYGSRNSQRFAFTLNQPIVQERLAFRFSADLFQTDGEITNLTRDGEDYNERESSNYRAKLRWDANDRLKFVLSFSHTDSSGGEDFIESTEFPDRRVTFSDLDAREGARHNIVGLKASYDINESWSLESNTSFYQLDYYRLEDQDYSQFNAQVFDRENEVESITQDLRLSFDHDTIKGAVGLFYTSIDDDVVDDVFVDFRTFDPRLPFFGVATANILQDRFEERENFAIYGEVDIAADRLLPGLSFTAGARYDYERLDFRATQNLSNIFNPSGQDLSLATARVPTLDLNGDYDEGAFLPKFGVTYDFAENQSVSLNYQRGYRAGGVQENLILGITQAYDAEFTDNFELAYRGQFYDGALRIAANAFYTEWEDQQVIVAADPSNLSFGTLIGNAGASELYGAELLVEADPTANLSLYTALSYTNTEYVDLVVDGANQSGNQFSGAPEFTASLGGAYRWDNGVTFSVDATYTDEVFENVENTVALDSRVVVNAQLTAESDNGLIFGLYARNLFDEQYETSRVDLPAVSPTTGGNERRDFVRAGESRTVGFFVTKTF